MYQVGEWIFYGNVGACQVMEISTKKIPGTDSVHPYYTLRPLSDDCSISIPADSVKVFMRPLITREEAEALIAAIPGVVAPAYYNTAMRQLTDHYEEVLNTHDCWNLIQMTMSIYEKKKEASKQKRKLGAVDERFMKRAEDLVYGELSIALGIEKNQVQGYIAQRLKKEA